MGEPSASEGASKPRSPEARRNPSPQGRNESQTVRRKIGRHECSRSLLRATIVRRVCPDTGTAASRRGHRSKLYHPTRSWTAWRDSPRRWPFRFLWWMRRAQPQRVASSLLPTRAWPVARRDPSKRGEAQAKVPWRSTPSIMSSSEQRPRRATWMLRSARGCSVGVVAGRFCWDRTVQRHLAPRCRRDGHRLSGSRSAAWLPGGAQDPQTSDA